MSYNEIEEIDEALRKIADKLTNPGFRKKIEKSVKNESPVMIDKIVSGCENVVRVLAEKYIVLSDINRRNERIKRWKRKYGNTPIDRPLARKFAGVPESTFDRKTAKIKKIINDTPHYTIDDLERVFQLILDSAQAALCTKTYYCLDVERNGYIQFEKGEHYKIIENESEYIYLYNERFDITMKVGKSEFSENFSIEGEMEFDADKYNT
ncbi:hypothetical protein [uncultured Draconibacterium sp.]|uniref:hypothetical protein n=1 Tax=uncultured Draconibacterium sp. TaxID=1573823 RepID=UPI0025D3BE19|nr:hypothetical protein [uncultured Draconibacterium sp.]